MPLQVFDISLGERSVPHSTLTLASSRAASLLLVLDLGKRDVVKFDDDFSKGEMQSDSCFALLLHQKHFLVVTKNIFLRSIVVTKNNSLHLVAFFARAHRDG